MTNDVIAKAKECGADVDLEDTSVGLATCVYMSDTELRAFYKLAQDDLRKELMEQEPVAWMRKQLDICGGDILSIEEKRSDLIGLASISNDVPLFTHPSPEQVSEKKFLDICWNIVSAEDCWKIAAAIRKQKVV
jgi:hypothetical protein